MNYEQNYDSDDKIEFEKPGFVINVNSLWYLLKINKGFV